MNPQSRKIQSKNTHKKSVTFLVMNNEKPEKEMPKTIPHTSALKRIQYFEINLVKEVKDIQKKLQNIPERN